MLDSGAVYLIVWHLFDDPVPALLSRRGISSGMSFTPNLTLPSWCCRCCCGLSLTFHCGTGASVERSERPEVWSPAKHTLPSPTDAYGTIEFQGGPHPSKAQVLYSLPFRNYWIKVNRGSYRTKIYLFNKQCIVLAPFVSGRDTLSQEEKSVLWSFPWNYDYIGILIMAECKPGATK